jgi:hypothetical protein
MLAKYQYDRLNLTVNHLNEVHGTSVLKYARPISLFWYVLPSLLQPRNSCLVGRRRSSLHVLLPSSFASPCQRAFNITTHKHQFTQGYDVASRFLLCLTLLRYTKLHHTCLAFPQHALKTHNKKTSLTNAYP